MKQQHRQLASGSWNKLSLIEQMANIGSEVERAISWKNKNNFKYSQMAFFRSLELLHLTIKCSKNRKRLRELTRTREALVDYFDGENQYFSSDELWQKYFFSYNYLTRVNS